MGRQIQKTDGRGNSTQYEHNALGELIAVTNALGHKVEYDYDANGKRIAIRIDDKRPSIDATTGMPTGSEDDLGHITHTFAYDILGKQVEANLQADFEGQAKRLITRHRYDKDGNRILTLKPRFVAGENGTAVTSTAFDERGLVFVQSRGGLNIGFLFPAHADVMADPQIAALPLEPAPPAVFSTNGFFYDLRGKETVEFDGEGHTWVTEYDSFGRVFREYRPAVGGASQGHYDESAWNPAGHRLSLSSYESTGSGSGVLLAQSTYAHDELGRTYEINHAIDTQGLSFVTIADGTLTPGDGWVTERRLLDPLGRLIVSVDDNRRYEGQEFDGRSRATRSWDGAGDDLAGASWTAPASTETTLAYDMAGNAIQETTTEYRDDGTSETFTSWRFFDSANRATARLDSLGHADRRLYDSRRNVIFESDARSTLISTTYLSSLDGYGEHGTPPTMAINDHGNTVVTAFDDASRERRRDRAMRVGGTGDGAIDTTEAGDGWIRTETDYDSNGNVVARRDDNGNESQYVYDALDRRQQFGFAGGAGVVTTQYDRNDRITQSVDARGSVETTTYDAIGRKTDVAVQRAAGVVGTTWEHYDYDGLDRIVLASDNDSTVTIDYDSLSNRVRETQNGETILSPHNGLGQVVSITYPGGRTIARTYDAVNRLAEVVDTGISQVVARSHYVGPYRLENRELLPSGASALIDTTIGYDADRRVIETLHERNSDGLIVDHRTYQWDRTDNKVLRTDVPASVSHAYAYDSQSRLVQSVRSGSVADRTVAYELDGVGNRMQVTGGPQPGSYTLGATGYQKNLYTFTPTERYFYDAKGNIESHYLFSLNPPSIGFPNDIKYDYRNRMVRHDSAAGVVSIYRYDVFGRRIEKKVAGTPTYYYYHKFHAVEEQGARGGTIATYVYSDRADDVLSMRRGTKNYFYHADDQGNVMRVSGSAGAAIATELYDYEDYGALVNGLTFQERPNTSRIGNRLFFSGRRYDPETGYYYFRHRYLDPVNGRFTTRDPIGTWGDESNLGNPFAYVGNNPWSARDRSGLEKEDEETPEERRDRLLDEYDERLDELKDMRDRGEISESEYRDLRDKTRGLMDALRNMPSTMLDHFPDIATEFMNAAERLGDYLVEFTEKAKKVNDGHQGFRYFDGNHNSTYKTQQMARKWDLQLASLNWIGKNYLGSGSPTHTHQPPTPHISSYECSNPACVGPTTPPHHVPLNTPSALEVGLFFAPIPPGPNLMFGALQDAYGF